MHHMYMYMFYATMGKGGNKRGEGSEAEEHMTTLGGGGGGRNKIVNLHGFVDIHIQQISVALINLQCHGGKFMVGKM